MVQWSQTEIAVFIVLMLAIAFKIWSVWHVQICAKASREGKLIFFGLVSGLTAFAVAAKFFISYQMAI
ncbi:MAG: hypothetical protein CMI01_17040 [Oceanospirillaceae bacterium]|jgi:hypothetical protein|uniref:hypothetical protein n=1 Tax=Marinobacterium litorale TaxID=404770 RepID=UPI000429344A|nr:hypothetical protein [Marinobacterium litorale]MBT00359.1 hypothetical protein [Oceanospirillaceae bacterium]